jgi:type IV secretory pathway VirB4 component
MSKEKKSSSKISRSTQEFLDIAEIKDDTVIMRDGTLRAVILVSSINFSLKSEDEQNAIISSYVRFLNNLDFIFQIVIQSRELNIGAYIEYLEGKEKEQTNKLLKMQTGEYIEYIKELTSIGKIMNKRFYVVVPYNPLSDKRKGFFSSLREALSPVKSLKLQEKKFQKFQLMLDRRLASVTTGLDSMGVSTVRLDTQSLIELYYKTYNPDTAKNQELADVRKLRVDI